MYRVVVAVDGRTVHVQTRVSYFLFHCCLLPSKTEALLAISALSTMPAELMLDPCESKQGSRYHSSAQVLYSASTIWRATAAFVNTRGLASTPTI